MGHGGATIHSGAQPGAIAGTLQDGVDEIPRLPDANEVDTSSGGGSSGGSLPPGYSWEEFTICANGVPETRWWPTWTANPS